MCISKCRRVRWTLGLLITIGAWMPLTSWSLGLGEIEVSSALNEKFEAAIPLLDAAGLQESEIIVSLASTEDFERVGVERFFFLTTLKFAVDVNGVPHVVVSSSKAISEPYINFIVEVLWPKGKLLKEFTVLLDPPTFTAAAAPPVTAPTQVTREVQQTGTQVGLTPTPAPQQYNPNRYAAGDGEIMTTRDDTLWKIAERTLPSAAVSVDQQMLAIQRLNPNAFIRNNINLLKAGYALQLPSESEALAINRNEANQEVAVQTEEWRAPGSGTTELAAQTTEAGAQEPLRSQLDASTSSVQTSDESAATTGQVRIVANNGDQVQGTDQEASAGDAQLLEENEALTRQVDELTYQLDREKELAANQVELKDRQLEIMDQEIAALQQRLAELEERTGSSGQSQNQSASTPAETPWWASPYLVGGVVGLLIFALAGVLIALRKRSSEVEALEAMVDEQTYGSGSYAAVSETETQHDIEPTVAAGEYETDATLADELEQSFDDIDTEFDSLDDDDTIEIAADAEGVDADELDSADTDAEDATDFAAAADSDDADQVTGDVIGEADIYIAYGRYSQATNLLEGALNNEPDREDVRLKMLEVCVEAGEQDGFDSHARYLLDNSDDEQVLLAVRDLEARMDERVRELGEPDLDDLNTVVNPESAATDDLNLELDDLDTLSTDGPAEDVTEVAQEDEFQLEFDDAATEVDAVVEGAVDLADESSEFALDGLDAEGDGLESAAEDLGGDLGIDFEDSGELSDAASAPTDAANEAEVDAEVETEASVEASAESDVPDTDAVDFEDDAFEFSDDDSSDINATKLDLAEAYIDMGDGDGAADILKEVAEEGTPDQQARAKELLESL